MAFPHKHEYDRTRKARRTGEGKGRTPKGAIANRVQPILCISPVDQKDKEKELEGKNSNVVLTRNDGHVVRGPPLHRQIQQKKMGKFESEFGARTAAKVSAKRGSWREQQTEGEPQPVV